MTENKKTSRLFGLWTVVEDEQTALQAMRRSQYVAFYLTFSYSIPLFSFLLLSMSQASYPPEGSFQEYIEPGFAVGIAGLFLWLGLRIRKGKYGAVPYVCGWMMIEVLLTIAPMTYKGLLGVAIFGILAVSGLRGWFYREKYGLVAEKRRRSWLLLGTGAIFGALLVAVIGMGFLVESGVFPSTQVVSGTELPASQKRTLVEHGILNESDEVEFFYSEGVFSVTTGGQFLTSEKLVVYEELDGSLSVYERPYAEIESVEIVSQGGFLEDSLYAVNGKPNVSWEYTMMYLSVENGGDKLFIDRLQEHIANN